VAARRRVGIGLARPHGMRFISGFWRLVMMSSIVSCLVACDTPSGPGGDPDDPGDPGGRGGGGSGSSVLGPVASLPLAVDLGAIDCGSAASGRFEIANPGDTALTYSLQSKDPHVAVAPEAGTVTPGAAVPIEVTAALPAEVDADTRLETSIAVTTNASAGTRVVSIKYRARGAQIGFDHTTLGFGETEVGFLGGHGFQVTNTGNLAAAVAIAEPGGEFSRRFGDAGSATIAPGATTTGEFGYLPVSLGADTARAGVTITGAHCGRQVDHLTLVAQAVPGAGVLVQGGPVDFGDARCNQAPAARQLHLVNHGALDGHFTARLLATTSGNERLYRVAPAEGTVPAGGAIDVVVSTDAIVPPASPRSYAATLRVVTTLGGVDVQRDIGVRQTLRSAELRASGSLVDFGVFPAGAPTQSLPFAILNAGNAPATLRVTPPVGAPFSLLAPATIAGNATGTLAVRYTPTGSPSTQDVTIGAVDACTPPVTLRLQGGTGPFAVVGTATATATCPPPATMATELLIANQGDRPLSIHCREHGTSGLGVAFPLRPDDPIDLDTGYFSVAPHSTARMLVTMSPGPIVAGSVTAQIDCFDNEPITSLRTTTVTRTLQGEGCAGPGAP
jgi:hypothetical protein